MKKAFEEGEFLMAINEALLVLLPKVASPVYVKHFRPISLCFMLYKLVTKVLVNCLKLYLSSLIGPFQVSFVLARQVVDNILVAQELIYTIRRNTS